MDEEIKEEAKAVESVRLEHKFNYVGGPYAYKNSSKTGKRLDPENLTELVLMTKPGQASKVNIAFPQEDKRVGVFPQHNSPEFKQTLELIPSRNLDPYANLGSIENLEAKGFQSRICSMTKQRLAKIHAQYSHLSEFAFNQMLDITRPDKRDFQVWFKRNEAANQVLIAYPSEKTQQTNFVQVIQYDDAHHIISVKHCSFDKTEPIVINETTVDQYRNLRQIAHLGARGESKYLNSVERFDDGTVCWTISLAKETATAALRPSNEIVFAQNLMNHCTEMAARNLGAEDLENDEWAGKFSLEACKPESHPLQEAYKNKVRKQINQIIDGAAIPGLDPIFWI